MYEVFRFSFLKPNFMNKFLVAFALSLIGSSTVIAQNSGKETIEGNGKSVVKEIPVQSFDALKAEGVYELRLTQSDQESVKIEADENLQEYFTVKNESSALVIDTKKLKNKNLKAANKMKVYVSFKKLKSLNLATVGNVQSENQLKFDDLELDTKNVGNVTLNLLADKLVFNNKAVGNIELTGKGENVVVKNKGVGSFFASKFVVQNMDIENDSVGHADVNAEKNLKVKDSFLGKVKNSGAAPVRRMNKVAI